MNHTNFIELFINNILNLNSEEDYIFFNNLIIGQYESGKVDINHLLIILYCLPTKYTILMEFIYNKTELSVNSGKFSDICKEYKLHCVSKSLVNSLNLDYQNIINCYNRLNIITKISCNTPHTLNLY